MTELKERQDFQIPDWYYFLEVLDKSWLSIDISDFSVLSKTDEFKNILDDLLDRIFNRLENMEFAEFIKSIILWTINLADYKVSSLESYKNELRSPRYVFDATFSLRLGFTKQIRFSLFWDDESDMITKNIKDSLIMLSNFFKKEEWSFDINANIFFDVLETTIDDIIKQKRKSVDWALSEVLSS